MKSHKQALLDSLPQEAFINGQREFSITDEKILTPRTLQRYNEANWKRLFPYTSDYRKLQLTDVGMYSIAKPHFARELLRFVTEQCKRASINVKTATITETNGGLGGFSMGLLPVFERMNIIEINPTHYDIIKNNLKVYGLYKKNVKILKTNYVDVMDRLQQDIIISDPPWGGTEYIKETNILLDISNVEITHIINYLFKKNKFKLFIFLAPQNYNFNYMMAHIATININIKKVGKHYFVCILNI